MGKLLKIVCHLLLGRGGERKTDEVALLGQINTRRFSNLWQLFKLFFFLYNRTATTNASSCGRRLNRGRCRREISVDLHFWSDLLKVLDGVFSHRLTIIEVDSFQDPQVECHAFECRVSDVRTIVQFKDLETISMGVTKIGESLVSEILTVRQRQTREVRTSGLQMSQSHVRYQNALLKVHSLQIVAVLGQSDESRVGEILTVRHFQGLELGTAVGNGLKRHVRYLLAVRE